MIYLIIFILKVIENTLSTLRLIIVADGKKKLGAILQGIVALLWIIAISIVIVDIKKDMFKIIFFILGSIVGSYLGSILEEKIALGDNIIICLTNKKYENIINDKVAKYNSISLYNNDSIILLIITKRKNLYKIKNILTKIDKKIIIISEKAKTINYHN